jgi:ferredoxin
MLKKFRITLAIIFTIAITLLFLDFTGTVHTYLGWLAKIQFLPAVLALNVGVIIALVLITLIFGRLYCSIICPLGVMQDFFAWLGKKSKHNRYKFSSAINWLRYTMLAIFIVTLIAGVAVVPALLAPYSTYGRIVQSLLSPLWIMGNNYLATLAERADSYTFYTVDVWLKSIPTIIAAAAMLVILIVLSWRNGRTYCNTICPVGTVLGFISRFSYFKYHIDTDKCNGCGLCGRNCKASCIDGKKHRIDASRCVACMNCLGKCRQNAISYCHKPATTHSEDKVKDNSRRNFLAVSGIIATTEIAKAAEKKVDGGLAVITDKQKPKRTDRIVPPGAVGIKHFEQHCTACQLCVAVCPNQVLRPSDDVSHFMQPEVSYERGYCRPECNKCSQVCPTGAIKPLTLADKSATQIGHAVWIKKNCVPLTDGVDCGNCARHCPVGAISMFAADPDDMDSVEIPHVDTEKCIGCGACENLCPARPFSAIYVEGHQRHRTI